MTVNSKIIVLILLFVISNSSFAGIKECEGAFESRFYSQAHKDCSVLTEDGKALFIMGLLWEKGLGIDNPKAELACRNFFLSAKQNYCKAYQKTADCFRNELIFEASKLTKELDVNNWTQKARNCTDQSNIVNRRQKGIDAFSKGRFGTAISYLKSYADNDDDFAQYYVGVSYFEKNDIERAKSYLKKSANNNNLLAKAYLKKINPPKEDL